MVVNIKLHLLVSVSLLFCFLLPLRGQQNAIINGTIYDEEGKPLFSASVVVENENFGTVTDTRGKFSLEVAPDRQHIVIISYLGYHTYTDTLYTIADKTYTITQQLKPDTEEIEGLTKYGTYDRRNTLTRIDIRSIDKLPTSTGSIESFLQITQMGVSSGNELSSQYSVRGGNYDENLIYVNDIEIHRPVLVQSAQQEGLSFINPSMISSIEFSAGGFEARFGDKMSSVLDIKYNRPSEFKGTASASLLGGTAHLEGVTQNNRFTYNTGIRYKTTRYLLNSLQVEGDYNPSFMDAQTFLTYDISKSFEIGLMGNVSTNRFNLVPSKRSTDFGTFQQNFNLTVYYEGQEYDKFDSYLGAVSINFHPNEKLSMKIIGSGFISDEVITYDILGEYWLNLLSRGSSGSGDTLINIGTGAALEHARNYLYSQIYSIEYKGTFYEGNKNIKWGLKYQEEMIEDNISEWVLIDSAGLSLPYSSSQVNLFSSIKSKNNLNTSRISGYLQNTWNFNGNTSDMYLTLGMRSAFSSLNDELLVSPRGSFTIDPHWNRDIKFHLSSGYYYQPPFYKEFRTPEGKLLTGIKAQKSIHIVLGSDLTFFIWDRPFIFSTEAYYKHLTNLIPYKTQEVEIQYLPEFESVGYATGIDFKVYGEFVEGAESWLSISIMDTKEDVRGDYYVLSDRTVVVPGYYSRPTHQTVSFSVFFQDYFPTNPDFKFNLSAVFGSGFPIGGPLNDRPALIYRIGPYRRIDIGISRVLKRTEQEGGLFGNFKDIWFAAEIYNVLNLKNKGSVDWIQTVENNEGVPDIFAVPNYLTGRRFNLKLIAKF